MNARTKRILYVITAAFGFSMMSVFVRFSDFLFFRQIPDLFRVLGYILICGAGIGIFLYNKRGD